MVLSAALRQRGYDVAVAQDAVAAMSAAVKLRPQVVVLDVGLPGGEGTVVMRRMHAMPQLAGVPVVMMSGRDPEKYRAEALEAGASAYLTKPVDPDALVLALRVAMGEDVGSAQAGAACGPRRPPRRLPQGMGLVTEAQIASALARHGVAADALPPALMGKVILLVDDDEELLVALAAPLRRRGYEVACATDAVTAISTAVKQPPDVVIMDIGLPGGDGITVMQRLHSLPQLAGVPVLMVSGRDPERNRDGAFAAGAVAYFAKPVTPEALSLAVTEALLHSTGA